MWASMMVWMLVFGVRVIVLAFGLARVTLLRRAGGIGIYGARPASPDRATSSARGVRLPRRAGGIMAIPNI